MYDSKVSGKGFWTATILRNGTVRDYATTCALVDASSISCYVVDLSLILTWSTRPDHGNCELDGSQIVRFNDTAAGEMDT